MVFQEGQYVVSVNGWNCLDQSFNAVEESILRGPKHLRITVMQAADPQDEHHSCDVSTLFFYFLNQKRLV